MSELLIAILIGVSMTLTGCTKAGESTVSDYEQGGYFQEEQQIEQHKEVDEPKANTTTTQPTKINDKQQIERKQDNTRIINQQQNNKSTKGADKVKDSSKYEHKQDNQSTDKTNNYPEPGTPPTKDDEPDTTSSGEACGICGGLVYRGEGIVVKNFPGDGDEEGSVVNTGAIVHKSCYHRTFTDGSHYAGEF